MLFRIFALLACLGMISGCGDSAPQVGDAAPAIDASDDGELVVNLPEPPLESVWEAYYIGDAKVGYGHRTAETIVEDGKPLFRITADVRMEITRYDQKTVEVMSWESVETPEGRMLRCKTQSSTGAQVSQTTGELVDDKLQIEITTPGKTDYLSVPFDETCGGMFAAETSLRTQPIKPGETREVKAFHPLFNQVVPVRLTAEDYETTLLLEGPQRLLRVVSQTEIEVQPGNTTSIDAVHWVDDHGRILKMFMLGTNQTSYVTTREIAKKEGDGGEFDLGLDTIVKIEKPIVDAHRTGVGVYVARLEHANPAEVFASGGSQRVEPIDEHTARIQVLAVRPNLPAEHVSGDDDPTDHDRAPNNFIQSDHPQIVAIAAGIAAGETDPWKISLAVEKYVNGAIEEKNFSQAFATAAEVVETREGDCTEHSVLAAALCRAKGVPARTAMGLVYFDRSQGFAYHMWNEVWLGDHWAPIDATLGQGGVGAGHLKLTHTNLAGGSALAAFLPVAKVLGQLELTVEKIE